METKTEKQTDFFGERVVTVAEPLSKWLPGANDDVVIPNVSQSFSPPTYSPKPKPQPEQKPKPVIEVNPVLKPVQHTAQVIIDQVSNSTAHVHRYSNPKYFCGEGYYVICFECGHAEKA